MPLPKKYQKFEDYDPLSLEVKSLKEGINKAVIIGKRINSQTHEFITQPMIRVNAVLLLCDYKRYLKRGKSK